MSSLKEALDQKGYLKIDRLFPEDALAPLVATLKTVLKDHFKGDHSPEELLRNIHRHYPDKGIFKPLMEKVTAEIKQNEKFIEFSRSEVLKSLFHAATGEQLSHLHFHLRPNYVEDPSQVIPWHRDQFYNNDDVEFLTLWMPLIGAEESGGGLIVIEGSHHFDNVIHKEYLNTGMFTIPPETLTNRSANYRHVHCPKGDVILLHPMLVHSSAKNLGPHNRWALVLFMYGE